jgi:RND family efflux transporter MFP subunit
MSVFKQGAITLLIVCAAAFAWLKLYPGAGGVLARYGIDHPALTALAATESETADDAGARGPGGGMGGGPRIVVTADAGTAMVNDRVNAIGNGQAINSVMVTPSVTGNLAEVNVRSGQRVEEGDVIARLDSDEQTIALERARLDLENTENTLARRNALRSASASSISNVEITEAELAVQTARLQLREAELNLSRRDIVTPISGIIGIVAVNPGDYVTTDTEIVTVDDRSELLVDFWVPERFASIIEVGQRVSAIPISNPDRRFEGEVDAVDNRVDSDSRTLRVRASVPNEDDRLRAGMSFSVTMNFDGDSYPTVDPLSVQWSADGSYVWRVVNDTTERVPVRIVQRNSDSVLVDGEIAEGDLIITEGLLQLREGTTVAVADEADPAAAGPVAEGASGPDAALTTRASTVRNAARPTGS